MENKNQPAFPHSGYKYNKQPIPDGLTKREYFAGLAMQGLLAGNYSYLDGNENIPVPQPLCEHSLQIADELLKQLEHP